MIQTVEHIGGVMLCCYPRKGWAVFIYKPDADGDWKSVKNGKLEDVIKEYNNRRQSR